MQYSNIYDNNNDEDHDATYDGEGADVKDDANAMHAATQSRDTATYDAATYDDTYDADAHEQHTIDDTIDDQDKGDDEQQQQQQHITAAATTSLSHDDVNNNNNNNNVAVVDDDDDYVSAFSFHRVKELLKLYTRLTDNDSDDEDGGEDGDDDKDAVNDSTTKGGSSNNNAPTPLIARDAVYATSEAVALLLRDLVRLAAAETARRGRQTVTYDDMARVVQLYDRYAYLVDVLPPSAPPAHATRHLPQALPPPTSSSSQRPRHGNGNKSKTQQQQQQQNTLRQLTLPF